MDRKRQDAIQKEQQRWQHMDAERQAEEARMQQIRDLGLKGKMNKSSEHFNIISLDYHPTPEGDKLKYKVAAANLGLIARCQLDPTLALTSLQQLLLWQHSRILRH